MSLYKPPNSNFWWSDLRHNGKRLRETEQIGRRDWTRTNDPHHVKVRLSPGNVGLAPVFKVLWPHLWP